jgi:hypothetical protein
VGDDHHSQPQHKSGQNRSDDAVPARAAEERRGCRGGSDEQDSPPD